MSKSATPVVPPKIRARIALLVIALLFMYLLLPRLGDFSHSWSSLIDAKFGFVAVGMVLVVGTYIAAGSTYRLLAARKLRLMPTITVQVASAFTNRLLPAGLGGLTTNVQYLRRSKHTLAEALSVAGTNNALGLIGHALLFVAVLVWSRGEIFDRVHLPHLFANQWAVLAVLLIVIAANLIVFKRLRNYIYRLTDEIVGNLFSYRTHPFRLLGALVCSIAVTSLHVGVLYFCALAVGLNIAIWAVFAAFTVGIVAGTATPTPGGLGGVEAGLMAGLVSYGVAAPEALAAALLYRLLTFWLPLLPGLAVFLSIRKRYL
jgi:undecaprenyl-diphosphatase